jgi:putative Mg2+ transporter-C (MgtC) family protein
LIEAVLPSEFYAHFHVSFKRASRMAEPALRQLVGACGFTIANMQSRLTDGGLIYEYRMIIRSRERANAQRLWASLLDLTEVVEFRISPTGD